VKARFSLFVLASLTAAAGFAAEGTRTIAIRGARLVTVSGPVKEAPADGLLLAKSYVCDVETWIREGLVDYVIPSQKIAPAPLRRWRQLAGDRVRLWPDLMPRSQPPADYVALAKSYLEAGADGFALWDGERRHARLSQWQAVRQLGHTTRFPQISHPGLGHFRSIPLATLGGLSAQDSFRDG